MNQVEEFLAGAARVEALGRRLNPRHRDPLGRFPVQRETTGRAGLSTASCTCEPTHLDAGGYDPDCPTHDQETP